VTTYCVESPALDNTGRRVGTFRFRTSSKERALQVASEGPDRTIVEEDEMAALPAQVRDAVERAREE